MNIIVSLILIMSFIIIYCILVNLYAVLFRLTGIPKDKAKFQAVTLLTSVGFSTKESELITSSKGRRRIATIAMITGYSFSVIIVSLMINLFINFTDKIQETSLTIVLIIFAVFILTLIIINLPFVKNGFDKLIEKIAYRIQVRKRRDNVVTLLEIFDNKNAICEISINWVPDFLYEKTVYESKIKEKYNMNVLVLRRKNKFLDVTKDTIFQKGDVIAIFGNYKNILDTFKHTESNVEEVLDDVTKYNEIELINNYGTDAMAEITVNNLPEIFKGNTLITSGLKEKYQINVLMIKRKGSPIIVTKDTIIEESDEITVFGPYSLIKELFKENQHII